MVANYIFSCTGCDCFSVCVCVCVLCYVEGSGCTS